MRSVRRRDWKACVCACVVGLLLCGTVVAQNLPGAAKKAPFPAQKVATFGEFSDWVMSVAFSPDGTQLAAGGYETLKVYDVESLKEVQSIRVRGGYVRDLAFTPDGKNIVGGHYQGVTIWSVETGRTVKRGKGPRGYVTGIDISPDGSAVAAAAEDQKVRIYTLPELQETAVIEAGEYPVNGVAFHPSGEQLATVSGDDKRITKPGVVQVWSVSDGKLLTTYAGHEKSATNLAYSPDGRYLLTTSLDEKVNVYDVASDKALGFFGGHSRPTNAAIVLRDNATVISASGGRAVGKNEIKVWNLADGADLGVFEPHKQKITDIALSADQKLLATSSVDKSVVLWNIAGGLEKLPQRGAEAVAVAANDQQENAAAAEPAAKKMLKAGIIGLDTSHAIAFTKILNTGEPNERLAGVRVVAAYPKGSPDIESSTSRVPDYIEQIKKMDVEIVDSIPALLEKVDVVFLETNDGRPHLEQALPVFKAGKPVFIDKPVAGSLADAIALYRAAKKYKVGMFSSSSLRFATGAQEVVAGKYGKVIGCDAYSPCSLEVTHPDLYWYGIHGVETLFTIMGPGCASVTRASTPDTDLVVGTWKDGRIGTFRGLRSGKRGYGGQVFGDKGNGEIGGYSGYQPLIEEIVQFFKTGAVPVTSEETLQIYAFMEAADESKRQGGKPVTLESVMKKAAEEATKRLAELDK